MAETPSAPHPPLLDRLLLVDDDEGMRMVMGAQIEDMGLRLEACVDGRSAREALERREYDLVLLDWHLPDDSGIELCRYIRALPRGPEMYILLVTGNDTPDALRLALEAGADDFLSKPFPMHMLEIRVEVGRKQLRTRLQRLRAEAAINRERRFLQTVIDAVPSPIFFKGVHGHYQGCNVAFCDFLRKSRDDILGRTVFELASDEMAQTYHQRDQALLEGPEETQTYESTVESTGREARNVLFRKAKYYHDDGALAGLVGVILDITELRQTEHALIRAQQLAAVGTLAAGVAHEFNNINTSVIGFLELCIETHELEEDLREYLDCALRAARRSAGITNNLLRFARPTTMERERGDLNEVVRSTVKILKSELTSEGIDVQVEMGELPPILIDPSQIAQILLNLLINARHALIGRATRELSIATAVEGDMVYARVQDTGCGIAPEDQAKIFLPFYSTKGEHADPSSMQGTVKGTGLGLSVCDTIARLHEGEITVESTVGVGTTFTLWLPLPRPGELGEAGSPEGSDDEMPLVIPGTRLLVLDDEESVRQLLAIVLDRLGYETTVTDDGREALSMHGENRFDLMLVDLQMPKMSGADFLRQLTSEHPGTPVIVITGKYTPDNLGHLRDLGVADVLEKPFDTKTLTKTLARVLGGGGSA